MIDIAIGRFLQGNSDRAGEVELPGMIAALQQPEPLLRPLAPAPYR